MRLLLSTIRPNWKFLKHAPVYCCVEVQSITWRIPSVEQMSDVQMWLLLLLEVRAVGGSVPAFCISVSLRARGGFPMYVYAHRLYSYTRISNIVCVSVNARTAEVRSKAPW